MRRLEEDSHSVAGSSSGVNRQEDLQIVSIEPQDCCDGFLSIPDGAQAIAVLLCLLYVGTALGLAVAMTTRAVAHGTGDRWILSWLGVFLVLCLVFLALSLVLLYGTRRDKKAATWLWLVSHFALFSVLTLCSACGLIGSLLVHNSTATIFSIIGGSLTAVMWHWWHVVLVHYRRQPSMTSQQSRPSEHSSTSSQLPLETSPIQPESHLVRA